MIPTESESRAWMTAFQQSGDQAAGKALINAFYPFVISLIRRHVADFATVEDLTQQTFVRCFSRADQWKKDKPLEPWLARIAINLCRDHFRSRQKMTELRWSDLSANEQAALEATSYPSENRTDRHLEILASRARQAPMLEESRAPTGFAVDVLKSCRPLASDVAPNSISEGNTWRGWLFDRQWTRSSDESDETLLWMRFSLASLPI